MSGVISRRGFLGGSAAVAAMAAVLRPGRAAGRFAPIRMARPLRLQELPTPALVLDLAALERNLEKMARHGRERKIDIRPHTKTHKCPLLAQMQMKRGAVGVCAAKVSEAEVMMEGGIRQVLITSPVVTPEKIERVVALAVRSPAIMIVVDHAQNIEDFDSAARAAGIQLSVLLDLDTGSKRTGVRPGKRALELARRIDRAPSLRLRGLQAYSGHVMHARGHRERRKLSLESLASALDTHARIEAAGIELELLTGGGTGTFDIDSELEAMTDLQTGSYLFMDVQYREIGDSDSDLFDYFEPSLFVLITAISQPVADRITIDAGYKAFASESVVPQFRDLAGVRYQWGGDEHGILHLESPSRPLRLGDKELMIVSHCDPTVNLYDYYYPLRDGMVEELWPITARGRSH